MMMMMMMLINYTHLSRGLIGRTFTTASVVPTFRGYFEDRWTNYLKERKLLEGDHEPVFPEKYGVKQRDAYYKKLSFSGWGGASGHDAPMIA